jgi:hypothetical protein
LPHQRRNHKGAAQYEFLTPHDTPSVSLYCSANAQCCVVWPTLQCCALFRLHAPIVPRIETRLFDLSPASHRELARVAGSCRCVIATKQTGRRFPGRLSSVCAAFTVATNRSKLQCARASMHAIVKNQRADRLRLPRSPCRCRCQVYVLASQVGTIDADGFGHLQP